MVVIKASESTLFRVPFLIALSSIFQRWPWYMLGIITKDEVSPLIEVNNQALLTSFKDMLQETLSQIKRANEDTADL